MSGKQTTSRGERKRAAIRTAAFRSFRDHGYHDTSVDAVCRAVGISKGSFYWHYDSKQEVFVDLLETWTREVMEEVIQRFEKALDQGNPAIALASAFRRELPRGRVIVPLWIELTVLALREPEIQRALARFYRRARAAIAEMLRPHCRGRLDEAELQAIAAASLGGYVGVVVQELADPTWLDARGVADGTMAVIGRRLGYEANEVLPPVSGRRGRANPRARLAAVPHEFEPGRADAREVAALLAGTTPVIRERIGGLRDLVMGGVPGATERVIGGWKVIGYERDRLFCYLKPTREGELHLGFYDGARLHDPENLLQGTGKRRRHVVIAAANPPPDESLRRLVQAAAKAS